MTSLALKDSHTVENIAKVAYLNKNFGGIGQKEAFTNGKGVFVNIRYRYEYVNRWGYDMTEVRYRDTDVSIENAKKILEMRPDLKEELNNILG